MAKDKAAARDDHEAPAGPSWRNPGGDDDGPAAYCLGVEIMCHLRSGMNIPLSFWAGIFAEMEHHEHQPQLRRIASLALDILDAEAPPRRPRGGRKLVRPKAGKKRPAQGRT